MKKMKYKEVLILTKPLSRDQSVHFPWLPAPSGWSCLFWHQCTVHPWSALATSLCAQCQTVATAQCIPGVHWLLHSAQCLLHSAHSPYAGAPDAQHEASDRVNTQTRGVQVGCTKLSVA